MREQKVLKDATSDELTALVADGWRYVHKEFVVAQDGTLRLGVLMERDSGWRPKQPTLATVAQQKRHEPKHPIARRGPTRQQRLNALRTGTDAGTAIVQQAHDLTVTFTEAIKRGYPADALNQIRHREQAAAFQKGRTLAKDWWEANSTAKRGPLGIGAPQIISGTFA